MPDITAEQFPMKVIDNVAVPEYVRPREDICTGFKIRPDTDIILATYQKSGTTWTANILRYLLWPSDTSDTVLSKRVPWINAQDVSLDDIESREGVRVIKTHDPAEWLDDIAQGSNAKVIFVYRNAKDVAVSYYKHMLYEYSLEEVSFHEFYSQIYRNPQRVQCGLWENHLDGYLSLAKKRENVLVLRFEDMKEDLPREIRKIAKFIGVEYDEVLVEKVAAKTDFNYMKNDPTCNNSHHYKHDKFIRSGKVGGWTEYLTEEQAAELEKIEQLVYSRHSLV